MANKPTMFDQLRAQFGDWTQAVKRHAADISDESRFHDSVQRERDKAKAQGRRLTDDERRSIAKGFTLDELDSYVRDAAVRDAVAQDDAPVLPKFVATKKAADVRVQREDAPAPKKGWKVIDENDVHAALKRGKVKLDRQLLDPSRLAVTNAYRAPKGLIYFVAVLDDEPKNATLYRYSVSTRRMKAQKSGARQRMFYALEALSGAL